MDLKVRGRYFFDGDEPFFWLGDTAWLLLSRLSLEEAGTYICNRAAKGFNVLQVTLVHSPGYATLDGKKALLDDDFSKPCIGGFWEHARKVAASAAAHGVYIAFLPCWGGFVKSGKLNLSNAEGYAKFLHGAFGDLKNIIWVVGGDVRGDAAPEVFRLLGRTLKALEPDRLVGYHPFGRCSSSFWFGQDDWLDFNMFQSGHRDYGQRSLGQWDDNDVFYGEDNYRYVQEDLKACPGKPTLDGEPSYELIPHGLHDGAQPYWQAPDVRRYAYWSVFTGAAGHTYGDNAIMQFLKPGYKPAYSALSYWDEAMHDPGSGQMTHLKHLCGQMAFEKGRSAQEFILNNGARHAYRAAFLTPRGLMVYAYEGETIDVNTALLPFENLQAAWFDPVSGAFSPMGTAEKAACVQFKLPNRRESANDWVFLLTPGRE